MASTHACLAPPAPPALHAPAVAVRGGELSSLLPVALAVVVLSTLAGYVAFRIILLRHTPAARKLRRERALAAAASQPPLAAGPLPPSSTAPITPESLSPARRPPSATGEGALGLPGQQVRCHAAPQGAAARAAPQASTPLQAGRTVGLCRCCWGTQIRHSRQVAREACVAAVGNASKCMNLCMCRK